MALPVNVAYSGASGTTIYGGRSPGSVLTPGPGAVVVTGYAPTVSQGGVQTFGPGVGSIQITGYAPSISQFSGLATSFTLTSPNTQSAAPFNVGLAFAAGDVPASFTTTLTNYQVVVKRRWNDGSVKHAIVTGRAPLTANTPLTVNMTVGSPPTGSNLTAASIVTAAPTASIQCGSLGTVNLSSLLASPFRTWISGPEMVECHYQAAVGGGTLLSAWFHVRLFLDGRLWVRCIVENGYLDNGLGSVAGNANRSYIPTISINGLTVYNNGGVALLHYANTRWMVEGWIGTDPQVTPLHNTAYMRSTKLVPNYGYTSAAGATLNGLVQTYTPMGQGPLETDMGGTGFSASIGLLPNWDALYCTMGEARGKAAVLAGSSSLNSYAIVWRDKVSNLILKPSAWSNWNPTGAGGGGTDGLGAGTLTWEVNHHPGEGYLAYILTGDYWHLETLGLQAATVWLCQSAATGNGTSRLLRRQVRGVAWALRTVAQYAAIAPDAEVSAGQVAADYVTLLGSNYTDLATQAKSQGSGTWLGSLYQYSPDTGGWAGTGSLAPWMNDFMVSTHGFASDIDALGSASSSTADLIYARDWQYRWTVQRLGESGKSAEWDFTRAAVYGGVFENDNTENNYKQLIGDCFLATYGALNTVATNTLQGASGADPAVMASGYWGNLMPALTYAVDHLCPGAITAWKRLTGATNFAASAATFNDTPVFGTVPRLVFSPGYALPSSALTSTLIGTNFAQDFAPSGYTASVFSTAVFGVFGGGTFNPLYGTGGAYVHSCNGGHQGPNFQGAMIFDYSVAAWNRLDNANGVPYSVADYAPANLNGFPYYEVTAATAGQYPACAHAYASLTYLNQGKNGSVMYLTRGYVDTVPESSAAAHKQDLTTGLWTRAATGSAIFAAGEGACAYDTAMGRWYVMKADFTSPNQIPYLRRSDMTWQVLNTGNAAGSGFSYSKMCAVPERRILLYVTDQGLLYGIDLLAGTPTITALTQTGSFATNNANNIFVYHPRTGIFYQKPPGSGNVLNTITPPNDRSGGIGGTWTLGSVTIAGSGLPTRTEGNNHYTCLHYVPSIDRLAWVAGASQQVAIIKA